jgi:hypothetical protein
VRSGLVARYRGCVTEITIWRAEETMTNMVNRRNLVLSLLFPKMCSTDIYLNRWLNRAAVALLILLNKVYMYFLVLQMRISRN